MKKLSIISAMVILIFNSLLFSQNNLPVPYTFKNALKNGTRTQTGEPGANYWQNYAAYTLNIEFDPINGIIKGSEEINYFNNSPDTLKEIVFKIVPNVYKKGSPRQNNFMPEDITDGVKISSFSVNSTEFSEDKLTIEGTVMRVGINPLNPGEKLNLKINYSYGLTKNISMFNGRSGKVDDGTWFVAYFFPRIAVYDDIDGWDIIPHIGMAEFYNDFCDFDLNVKVPANFIVWATGDLQNASEVLTKKYVNRLEAAEKSEEMVTIIDTIDLQKGNITQNKTNNFRFISKNIPDVAFAVSDHYIWQSSNVTTGNNSTNKSMLDVVFNPEHKDYYSIFGYSKKSMEVLSFDFPGIPYPYSKLVIFDGNAAMEYPMMVNYKLKGEITSDVYVNLHEIAHTYFPFYMGINETKNGWIDEGFATFTGVHYLPKVDPSLKTKSSFYASNEDIGFDIPIITYTYQQNLPSVQLNYYGKPGYAYMYMKDLVGEENFNKGIRYFMNTWNGKHPTYPDFINCMNKGIGLDIDWFWKAWFYDSGVCDLALKDYKNENGQMSITVEKIGSKPVPIHLRINYVDGSEEIIHKKVDVWKSGNTEVQISFSTSKEVAEINLGDTYIHDLDLKNNSLVIDKNND